MSNTTVSTVEVSGSVKFVATHVTALNLPADGVIVDPGSAIKLDGALVIKGIRLTTREPQDSEMIEVYCVGPVPSTLSVDDAADEEKFVDLTGPGLDVPIDPYRRRIQLHYEADLKAWLAPKWT